MFSPSLSSDASRREITARSIFGVARPLAEFLNKLAGYDFGKSLNVMVLQKCAPAKSHEKTWELAGVFVVKNGCNWLIISR